MSSLNKERLRKTKIRKYELLCDKENTTQGATTGKKAHKVDLWEIKSQSGFGVPKRDAAIIRQAAAVSVRKFLELLKICQKSRNLSNTPFPVLLRLLAVCPTNTRKKTRYLQIYATCCKFARLRTEPVHPTICFGWRQRTTIVQVLSRRNQGGPH